MRTEIEFQVKERRCALSTNKKLLRIKKDGEVKWHKQQGNNNNHHQSKESSTQANVEMERIVGRLSKKNRLIINGKDTTRERNQMNQTNNAEQVTSCNEILEEKILNKKTHSYS